MTAPGGTGSSPRARAAGDEHRADRQHRFERRVGGGQPGQEVTDGRDPGEALLVDTRRGPGARPVPDEHRLSDAFDAFAAVHDRLS